MQFIPQPQALHVVGLALRTHNGEAFQTIPPHWARFSPSALAQRLPYRLSDDGYAVYTRFQAVQWAHYRAQLARVTGDLAQTAPGETAQIQFAAASVLAPPELRGP